jgi:hypothetical protein
MILRAAYVLLAQNLQEAADAMTSSDVRSRLQDAVSEKMRNTGSYGYYQDHMGDDESGDVIYGGDGKLMQAPYSMAKTDGMATKAVIDHENAVPVRARTTYEPEGDEASHYAQMEESFKKASLYLGLPLYERFISKDERDKADESDFAGKGKSFPILKPEDVMAAVRSIGRAGSGNIGPSGIKARIIAIAKRKGWTSSLPKSWQGTDAAKESNVSRETSGLKLVESFTWSEGLQISEASERATYPIKIISPGTGSSAHYPAAVLRKAAEAGKFPAKTLMFWNHATAAEEAARPEGNLDHLAAITTKPGVWMDNGPHGAGVYAEAAVMPDYATKMAARAPHIGVSIRAGGTSTGRMVEGKPELASLDYIESIDYVTKAGRGGMALAEGARVKLNEAAREAGILDLNEGGLSDMDAAEITKLKETVTSQGALIERLSKENMRGRAAELATAVLSATALSEAQRRYVTESVIGTSDAPRDLPVKEGTLDAAKLTEAINTEFKRYAATATPGARVTGMGGGPTIVRETAEQITAREAADKRDEDDLIRMFEAEGMSKEQAVAAVKGKAA